MQIELDLLIHFEPSLAQIELNDGLKTVDGDDDRPLSVTWLHSPYEYF